MTCSLASRDSSLGLAQAYRLAVIDLAESRHLISRLADFVGIDSLPASLQGGEQRVDQHVHRTGDATAFCLAACQAPSRQDPAGSPLAVFDIERRLNEHRACLQQDWVAYFLAGTIYVRADNPAKLSASQVRSRIDGCLEPHGCVDGSVRIKPGRCTFRIRHQTGKRKLVEERLARFLGKSLLGGDRRLTCKVGYISLFSRPAVIDARRPA